MGNDNVQQFHIYQPGPQVAISDTVGFTEALIVLVEKLNEVMDFVSVEGEDEETG